MQVSFGINDINFTETLKGCIKSWILANVALGAGSFVTDPNCSDEIMEPVPGAYTMQQMTDLVRQDVIDIHTVLAGLGYADTDYKIVVQSYAPPVGVSNRPFVEGAFAGCMMNRRDVIVAQGRFIPALETAQRQGELSTGLKNVWHVALSESFGDHTNCQLSTPSWGVALPSFGRPFVGITGSVAELALEVRANVDKEWVQESVHPNFLGHTQFAKCMSQIATASANRPLKQHALRCGIRPDDSSVMEHVELIVPNEVQLTMNRGTRGYFDLEAAIPGLVIDGAVLPANSLSWTCTLTYEDHNGVQESSGEITGDDNTATCYVPEIETLAPHLWASAKVTVKARFNFIDSDGGHFAGEGETWRSAF